MGLQQATIDYQRAKANYDLAMSEIGTNQQYELQILGKQVQQAQQGVKEAEQSVNQLLVNDVKSAELNVESLKARITDAQIVAPFDGEIMSLATSPGIAAEAYKPVMVIADPSALEVSADPSSNILKDLTEGMPVEVQLVSVPRNRCRARSASCRILTAAADARRKAPRRRMPISRRAWNWIQPRPAR